VSFASGAPSPLDGGGWEFPLSREEKKHRVMCLFEAELAEAQWVTEQNAELLDRNEVLEAILQGRDPVGVGDVDEVDDVDDHAAAAEPAEGRGADPGRGGADAAAASAAPRGDQSPTEADAAVAVAAFPRAVSQSSRTVPFLHVALVLAGAVLALALIALSPPPAERPLPEAAAPAPVSAAPSPLEALRNMRDRGLQRLAHNDCSTAEYWFSGALNLLAQAMHSSSPTEVPVLWWTEHGRLVADRGFALVCAKRHAEGVAVLEQHLRSTTPESGHLFNALGYAHFFLRDYARASLAFQAGTRVDPENPIIWNNLAAALMSGGEFQTADDALVRAMECDAKQVSGIELSAEQKMILKANANNLWSRVHGGGELVPLPTVELYAPPEAS